MHSSLDIHNRITIATERSLSSPSPIYGMVIHEASDLNPSTRVEYLGKNQSFHPLIPGLNKERTNYGDWADWDWLKDNKPVMCDWDGNIQYELDPADYTKQLHSSEPSDVSNDNYEGNAMAIIPKIYTCSYCLDNNRYVYFCRESISEDFHPVGFNVHGIVRDYMLIPMFYGSRDSHGRIRSLANQWSAGTISGNHSQNRDNIDMNAMMQYGAIISSSPYGLFFGGPLVNVLTDIAVMLSKTTDSQSAFGTGMSQSYTSDDDHEGHWGTIPNPIQNSQFHGGTDGHSFSNIFHSSVLGSNMLWQRDPYTLLVYGKMKVSTDYTFDLSGESYLDTNLTLNQGNYFATFSVIPEYGFIPCTDVIGDERTGYCDYMYANPAVISVASRFGCSRSGQKAGLFARSMNHSGFNRREILEDGTPLYSAKTLDESFSWWWNFGCSLMLPAPPTK